VRLGASVFWLGGLLTAYWSSTAQAGPTRQMGATSHGSITISVSVRPQVKLSSLTIANGSQRPLAAVTEPAQHICLLAGTYPGRYSVLLQSQPPNERSALLAMSEAITSTCRSVRSPAMTDAFGFELPRADSGQAYTLLIAPE
jgi:hypothetical protein